jgi:hypothetical protein
MRFLCLCPTYNRPWRLLEESLACFHSQVHKDAFLLIYDDLGVFPEQRHDNWALISTTTREPGIVEQYNRMLDLAQEFGPFDALLSGMMTTSIFPTISTTILKSSETTN